ncbi:MAG: hypothetical protein H0V70_02605 [Ktedonobacteraceae bacterium]|nr:hypothetical protein [Ktedonobacteraceae bacterium]
MGCLKQIVITIVAYLFLFFVGVPVIGFLFGPTIATVCFYVVGIFLFVARPLWLWLKAGSNLSDFDRANNAQRNADAQQNIDAGK